MALVAVWGTPRPGGPEGGGNRSVRPKWLWLQSEALLGRPGEMGGAAQTQRSSSLIIAFREAARPS